MSQSPEHQSQSQEGPAVSPGAKLSTSRADEMEDLAPPFSGRQAGSASGGAAAEGERQTPAPEALGSDGPASDSDGSGEELLPDFLTDDEPWESSDDTATGAEADSRSQPGVEEADPWSAAEDGEPDPWSAEDENRTEVPLAPGRDEEDMAAPDASLEDAVHRAADRLDAIARRLRAVGGDPDELSGVGRDDPLALLVVGFVIGEGHGR